MMRAIILAMPLLLTACPKNTDSGTAPAPAPAHPLDDRPVVGAAVGYTPETATTFELTNGLDVWLVERPGLPLVSMTLVVPGGKAADPDSQPGLTSLADNMLTRGAGDRDAIAFAEATEQLGIDISAATDATSTWVSMYSHADKLDEGLSLFADTIMRPRFDKDAVERARDQRLGRLTQGLDNPNTIASIVGDELYYGAAHPLAHWSLGTSETVSGFTPEQLGASWTSRAIPGRSTLVVAGAIDQATLTAALEGALGSWLGDGSAPALPEVASPAPAPGHYFVDNPGASQTILYVLMPGPAPTDAAYAPGQLAGVVLGGTFTSRLNRLLREEKGYTYGARASLGEEGSFGVWQARTAVRADATGAALADLLGELDRIREGIDEAELKKAKGAAQTRLVGSLSGVSGLSSLYAEEVAAGRGPEALATSLAAKVGATEADVDTSAASIPLDGAVVVVVGDLEAIQADVASKVEADWQVLERP